MELSGHVFTKAPERHQSFIQPSSTRMPGHKGSSSNIRFSGTPSQRRWQIPSYSNQSSRRRVCSHHRTPAGSPTAALSKDTLGTSRDLPGSGGPPGELLSACKWSCALQICTCNLRINKPRCAGCTNVLSDTLPSRSRNNRPFWTSTRRSRLVPRFRGEAIFFLFPTSKKTRLQFPREAGIGRGLCWHACRKGEREQRRRQVSAFT